MTNEDPRLGLSIESSSESCASDLSDSESGWEDFAPPPPGPASPNGSSWNTGELQVVRELPRTPSFRSRLPQRGRRHTAGSWDDDLRIARHPRAPSLRLCLTLCTLTLVLLSLTNNTRHSAAPYMDISPEDVVLPMYSDGVRSQARQAQLRSPRHSPEAERGLAVSSGASEQKAAAGRPRVHVAMARAAPNRPVFGAQTPGVEGLVHEGPPQTKAGATDMSGASNMHSWLAAVALVAMLLETGYKEYRQCRIAEEQQRRL
jgi:hypothetical protein